PYREWTEQLRHEASIDLSHPLRPLRSFFLETTSAGLSIPELYETPRRVRVDATASIRALSRTGGRIAPLHGSLMHRHVDAFVREGSLPPVESSRRRVTRPKRTPPSAPALARTMLETAGIPSQNATVVEADAGESIISELTAWHSKSACGIY